MFAGSTCDYGFLVPDGDGAVDSEHVIRKQVFLGVLQFLVSKKGVHTPTQHPLLESFVKIKIDHLRSCLDPFTSRMLRTHFALRGTSGVSVIFK